MNWFSRLFGSYKKDKVLLNILTRTSNRPNGFNLCRASIENQTYKNIRHIVSYDQEKDRSYLSSMDPNDIIKVVPLPNEPQNEPLTGSYKFAPYNLYCNELMDEVEEGWIFFLDDDDMLLHDKVVEEMVEVIKKVGKNTLLIWQMRYPDGKLLPPDDLMKRQTIKMTQIGAPCVGFHSKNKNNVRWDCWKAGDFRFIQALFRTIKRKHWIASPFIQLNNSGDFGIKTIFNSAHR